MTSTANSEAGLSETFWGVGLCGALGTAAALLLWGLPVALPVLLGALLAAANLWILSRLIRAYLSSGGGSWALAGTVKMGALLGAVYWLASTGAIDVLPLVAGYGALPAGIVVGRLRWAMAAPEER